MGANGVCNKCSALGPTSAFERWRGPHPLQQIRNKRALNLCSERFCQHRRLIVAAVKQTPAVQRHRRNQGVVADECSGLLRHPSPRWARKMQRIAVFEGKNKPPCHPPIDKDRSPTSPRRGVADALIAKNRRLLRVARHRLATAITGKAKDEGRLAPAGWAKPPLINNNFTAGKTQGWIKRAKRPVAKLRKPAHNP